MLSVVNYSSIAFCSLILEIFEICIRVLSLVIFYFHASDSISDSNHLLIKIIFVLNLSDDLFCYFVLLLTMRNVVYIYIDLTLRLLILFLCINVRRYSSFFQARSQTYIRINARLDNR